MKALHRLAAAAATIALTLTPALVTQAQSGGQDSQGTGAAAGRSASPQQGALQAHDRARVHEQSLTHTRTQLKAQEKATLQTRDQVRAL
jgi:hypothetical protein